MTVVLEGNVAAPTTYGRGGRDATAVERRRGDGRQRRTVGDADAGEEAAGYEATRSEWLTVVDYCGVVAFTTCALLSWAVASWARL